MSARLPGRWLSATDGGRLAHEKAPVIIDRRATGLTIRFFAPRDVSGTVRSRPRASRPAPVRTRGSRRVASASRAGPDDDPGASEAPPVGGCDGGRDWTQVSPNSA